MSRPKPLSGFPEFTPEGRIIEQAVLDRGRAALVHLGKASVDHDAQVVQHGLLLEVGGEESSRRIVSPSMSSFLTIPRI